MQENQKLLIPALIEDLGMININSIRKDTGAIARKRFGIYECPSCKQEFKAISTEIKNNRIKNCRLCSYSINGKNLQTHGETKTRLYAIYSGMKTRVFNKNRNCSKNYHLRGIRICDEWNISFILFKKWALENGYSDELTIDRIDNDGNYEPSNCRWATQSIQSRNTRVIHSHNTSGYRGVSFYKQNNKWNAGIKVDSKSKHLGYFDSPLDAAKAYDKYVIDNNLEHTINGVL